jgi:LDH2 family malate/lactate/ureidoglycolate dehydrogenase
MEGKDAEVTADVLLDADLRGIDTHGISLLALYAGWIAGGGFELSARAEVVHDGPSCALLDARGGLERTIAGELGVPFVLAPA